jgi:hypothetical protein
VLLRKVLSAPQYRHTAAGSAAAGSPAPGLAAAGGTAAPTPAAAGLGSAYSRGCCLVDLLI